MKFHFIEVKGVTLEKEGIAIFPDALLQAAEAGVQILAYDTIVEEDGMVLDAVVPVKLN